MGPSAAAFTLLLALFRCALAGELHVVVSGKYAGTVESYRVGAAHFLNAKEAATVYGGQVYWYPVSGRLQLSLRGRQLRFMVDSDRARIGDREVRLPHPVLLRVSRVFLPLDFFLSKDFAELAGMDSRFNAETGLLTMDKRANVGPLKWFSYGGRTRVELGLDPSLGYSFVKRGRSGFDLTIPFGKIEWSERVQIEDGLIHALQLRQEAALARLSVKLDRDADRWESRESKGPRRLMIDVLRADGPSSEPRGETGLASHGLPPPAGAEREPPKPAAEPAVPPSASSGAVAGARYTIVVDAGHGGKDDGARGRRGTREKNINLSAALELAALLREEKAFRVILTREEDVFVPLDERSKLANDARADLFVSVHCNAASNSHEKGFEIYFLSEQASDPESQRLADLENSVLALEGKSVETEEAASLLRAMAKTEFINEASELSGLMAQQLARRVDLSNRGVKQAAFYVLRGTNAPAVLLETGFITNAQDEAKLQSSRFRSRLVEGVYAGILEYAKRRGWRLEPG